MILSKEISQSDKHCKKVYEVETMKDGQDKVQETIYVASKKQWRWRQGADLLALIMQKEMLRCFI